MTDENKMTLKEALDDPTTEGALVDNHQVALLADAEINRQITTAKRYPRSVSVFRKKTLELVTLSESVATECVYALPRSGKTIEGPSIRFAEILQSTWGNIRTGTRVVGEDASFVIAQGACHDLENNNAMTLEIRRRITDKHGRRYNDDMIGVTGSAASSIALRNAILRVIPKALWYDMYVAARKVVAGDFETLPNRREAAIKAFVIYGIKAEQLYVALGVKGKEDIGIEHMITLAGFLNALKDGSAKPDDFFAEYVDGPASTPSSRPQRSDFEEQPQKKKRAKKEPAATPAEATTTAKPAEAEPSQPVDKTNTAPKQKPHPNAPPVEDGPAPYSDALTAALDSIAEATTPITLDRIVKEAELPDPEMVVLEMAAKKKRREFGA